MNTKYSIYFLLFVITSFLISCSINNEEVKKPEENWEKQLNSQFKLLGHRNWIVAADAPGIEAFRTEIAHLSSENTSKEVHEDINRKLYEASKLFNVIIFKTDFTIPYTSVFYQLFCKYWNEDAEKKLRIKITINE